MRILIAGSTYQAAYNGQAVFTVNLAENLAHRGHEVMALIPSERDHPYQTIQNGVRLNAIFSIPLGVFHPDIFLTLLPEREVQAAFQAFQPDIVHLHDHYTPSTAVLRVARRMGSRVVGTNHFMPENLAPYIPFSRQLGPAYEKVMWSWMLSIYNQLDMVTAPSRTAAAILRQQGLRVPVLPVSCGVDLQRFSPKPWIDRGAVRRKYGLDPDRTLVLFVGRIDGEKRLDVLVRALHLLDRQDIQLGIAGKGSYLGELKALVQQLGLQDRVHFTGFVPEEDLPSLLNSADIFAMPSEAELLSIATLEAMACARPLLLAQSLALPELATDGVNGLLFQAGNVEDAARCMTRLVNIPHAWPRMGAASLEKVQLHSIDNTLRSYERIYEGLLANGARQVQPARSPVHPLGKRIQEAFDQLWQSSRTG